MLIREIAETVWDKNTANKLFKQVKKVAKRRGMDARIVGSIATVGESTKDLDILVTPFDDDFDYENFMADLKGLGLEYAGYSDDSGEELDTFVTPDGKTVDVFVGDYDPEHTLD